MVHRLKCKTKVTELPEENMEDPCDHVLGKYFLDITPKARSIKKNKKQKNHTINWTSSTLGGGHYPDLIVASWVCRGTAQFITLTLDMCLCMSIIKLVHIFS